MKIDRRDRIIMNIVALNCRVTIASLARATKLSKDAVTYRLARLEGAGAIQSRMLMIDSRRLGFTRYHFLIRLDAGRKTRKDIIANISGHPFVMWVNSFVGSYDIQVIVDAIDARHLDRIRTDLVGLCKNAIKHYSVLTHLSDLEFTNLLPAIETGVTLTGEDDGSFSGLVARRTYGVSPDFSRVAVTRAELRCLETLADDPRISISDAARALSVDRATMRKRMGNLIRQGVILSFATIFGNEFFGVTTYYLLVRLNQNISRKNLLAPFKRLTTVFYAGQMLGDFDLIVYVNASSPQELNASIDSLREGLEDYIINYELLVQDRVHYWRHYTRGIHTLLLERSDR